MNVCSALKIHYGASLIWQACGLQEYVVLCMIEKKREHVSDTWMWGYVCTFLTLLLSSEVNESDINPITGVFLRSQWRVRGRLVNDCKAWQDWHHIQHQCGWASTHTCGRKWQATSYYYQDVSMAPPLSWELWNPHTQYFHTFSRFLSVTCHWHSTHHWLSFLPKPAVSCIVQL